MGQRVTCRCEDGVARINLGDGRVKVLSLNEATAASGFLDRVAQPAASASGGRHGG